MWKNRLLSAFCVNKNYAEYGAVTGDSGRTTAILENAKFCYCALASSFSTPILSNARYEWDTV